jgi:hypothetical protein
MLKQFYSDLKQQIATSLPEIKNNIYLWNNQFDHSNGDSNNSKGRDESAFQYPAVFIEFNDFEFRQLSLGVQEYDYICTIRLGTKSYLKEDLSLFDLSTRLYYVVQRFQQGNKSRLSRISEVKDINHNNVTITTTRYKGYGIDDSRYVLADPNLTKGYITAIDQTDDIVEQVDPNIPLDPSIQNGDNRFLG